MVLKFLKSASKKMRDSILTLLIFVFCTLFCYFLSWLKINDLNFLIVYVLGVILTAVLTKSYIHSLLLSILSVIGYNFFFTIPKYTFQFNDPTYAITFILMLIINLIISLVMFQLKHRYEVIMKLQNEKFLLKKESEKEQVKVTLLQSISHDLRTPLTAIKDGADLILSNENMEKADQHMILSDISEKSLWMMCVIENLLAITRINSDKLTVNKKNEVVDDVILQSVRAVNGIIGDRKIHYDLPQNVLLTPMDSILITQVLVNILNNAIKHTKNDGNIWIKVWNTGKNTVFRIVNDGDLINDIDLPHIFELYYTTGDINKNAGIGLAVCQLIIRAHEGTIEAYTLNGMVCFEFSLPLNSEGVNNNG